GRALASHTDETAAQGAHDVTRTPVLGSLPVLLLAWAGGLVFVSYVVFFFRTVSYASGMSTTALGATLAVLLIGAATGARQAGRGCQAAPADVMAAMVLDIMIANLVGAIFLPVLGILSWAGANVIGMALLLALLIARFWGSFLPNLAELGVAPGRHAGSGVGLIYFAAMLGAAAAVIITGFVLMDVLTLTGIAGWLVVIGLLTAVMLFA